MQFLPLSERSALIELGPTLRLRVTIERGRAVAQFLENDRTEGAVAISVPFVPPADPAQTRRISPPALPKR